MKKLISIALALALTLSMTVTAFADDIEINEESDTKSGSTKITYEVSPAYTVTIPEKVELDSETGKGEASVSAEGVKVAYGESVVVKLTGINEASGNSGDSEFNVKTADGNASLKYKVTKADNSDADDTDAAEIDIDLNNNTVLSVASGLGNDENGASKGETTLSFALADTVTYAGSYSGRVTFTVSVE